MHQFCSLKKQQNAKPELMINLEGSMIDTLIPSIGLGVSSDTTEKGWLAKLHHTSLHPFTITCTNGVQRLHTLSANTDEEMLQWMTELFQASLLHPPSSPLPSCSEPCHITTSMPSSPLSCSTSPTSAPHLPNHSSLALPNLSSAMSGPVCFAQSISER